MKQTRSERGASAVEFALVVPLLLILLLGIVEFGRVFNAQMQVTAAARDGVRVMAIHDDPARSKQAAASAAPGLNPALSPGQVTVAPGSCSPNTNVTVTVNYSVTLLSGLFGTAVPLTGKAVMRCGG